MRKASALIALAGGLGLIVLPSALGTSRAKLRPCKPSDYEIETTQVPWTYQHRFHHGGVLITPGISTRKITPCRLQRPIRVRIRYRRKLVTAILGNPAVWRIDTVLRAWDYRVHSWVWRNWCHSSRPQRFAIGAGRFHTGRLWALPPCRDRHAPSRLVQLGSGVKGLPFTGTGEPAKIGGFPDSGWPLGEEVIHPKNTWEVSDGRSLVVVYAGASGHQPRTGTFLILRQNLMFGTQDIDVVNTGRTGGVWITKAPLGKHVETSAQHGTLRFRSKSGRSGVFRLSSDTVKLDAA